MLTTFEYLFFVLFTIFAFTKALSYGIYEIKQENNKIGGIFVILVGLFASIISNVALFFNKLSF